MSRVDIPEGHQRIVGAPSGSLRRLDRFTDNVIEIICFSRNCRALTDRLCLLRKYGGPAAPVQSSQLARFKDWHDRCDLAGHQNRRPSATHEQIRSNKFYHPPMHACHAYRMRDCVIFSYPPIVVMY